MNRNFQDIQKAFAAHIRNPEKNPMVGGIEARRAKIYSELFYNNVESFVARAFPVIKKIFGDDAWHKMLREFLETHSCQSPYFQDIAEEFLHYLQQERNTENDPPFLLELAHYEWSELVLEVSQKEIPETGFNPEGNLLRSQIVISPLVWVLHYQWPVHQISPEFQPDSSEQAFFLIVYRNRNDQVRFMESNAVSARLLNIIQEQSELTGTLAIEALSKELEAHGHNIDLTQLLEHGEQTLNALREKDIILGTRLEAIS
jgi:hypothetical protein